MTKSQIFVLMLELVGELHSGLYQLENPYNNSYLEINLTILDTSSLHVKFINLISFIR